MFGGFKEKVCWGLAFQHQLLQVVRCKKKRVRGVNDIDAWNKRGLLPQNQWWIRSLEPRKGHDEILHPVIKKVPGDQVVQVKAARVPCFATVGPTTKSKILKPGTCHADWELSWRQEAQALNTRTKILHAMPLNINILNIA